MSLRGRIILDEETLRKVVLIRSLTGKSLDQAVADAVELYYEVNDLREYDNGGKEGETEADLFRQLIFSCDGSVWIKGRVCNILRQHSIWTKLDFVNAQLGRMMNFQGIGDAGRDIIRQLTKKILATDINMKVLPTRL